MVRDSWQFKDRVVARLLPPESAVPEIESREVGVTVQTLERWRSDALLQPARQRIWTAAARLEAVIITAALDAAARVAWCRERGVYAVQLEQWRDNATQALAEPEEVRTRSAPLVTTHTQLVADRGRHAQFRARDRGRSRRQWRE